MTKKRRRKQKKHDWLSIQQAFVTRSIRPSQRDLAEEFGCCRSDIQRHQKKEGWVEKREKYIRKYRARVEKISVRIQVERLMKELSKSSEW